MNFRAQFKKDLRRHEGYSLKAYLDTEGVWTIGIGHTGPEVVKGLVITDEQADALFEQDMNEALRDVVAVFPNFHSLSGVRRTVLANMAFNLGRTKLNGFHRLKAAVKVGDWQLAVLSMINSRWYSQVKGRGKELADRMGSDKILPIHLAN